MYGCTLQEIGSSEQNGGQKIFGGGLDILKFEKNARFIVFVISILGALKFCFGGLAHQTPPPRGDGTASESEPKFSRSFGYVLTLAG